MRWAQLGNHGWGWDDVLPFFKRAERWTGEEAEIHGTEGNLTTSPMTERPEACHAIIQAAEQLGLEYRPDVNNLPRGARRLDRLMPTPQLFTRSGP